MTVEVIFASHNNHKATEIRQMMPHSVNLTSLSDLNFFEDIPETGTTLKENAVIKASAIYNKFKKAVFADDTGLIVDALNGAPGVYSARYAGETASYVDNCEKLLQNLQNATHRQAKFVTVICFIDNAGETYFFEGTVEGEITEEFKGTNGFGYDPLFLPEGGKETFAQMSAETKNNISHRARAFQAFMEFFKENYSK